MRNDIKTTSIIELRYLAEELIRASMQSQTEVEISFRAKPNKVDLGMTVTFYKDSDLFFLEFYSFYSFKTNNKLLDKALELIKDETKFEEVKLWRKEFRG